MRVLNRALDLGVNFFDTADVYGDGRNERLLGALRSSRTETFHVATKVGLRLDPHVTAGYTRENLFAFVDRSLRNLGVKAIDLLQLHSPPTEVYYRPQIFATLEDLVNAGKVKHCGASVNLVEEGLKVMEYPIVQTVQIIHNIFANDHLIIFQRSKAAWCRGAGTAAIIVQGCSTLFQGR